MTGFELLLLKLVLGGGAAAVATRLTWDQVRLWLGRKLVEKDRLARVVKTTLDTGNYRVVANVFSTRAPATAIASKTWTARSLDPALETRFAGRTEIVIEAT